VPQRDDLVESVKPLLRQGDLVIVLGAGTFTPWRGSRSRPRRQSGDMDGAVGTDLALQLRESFAERVRFHEPLARHTSFCIGGPADAWVEVASAAEIALLHELARMNGVTLLPLGGGTNVLVSDRGVRGIVMQLGPAFRALEWFPNGSGTRVRAGAAVRLTKLVEQAAARG